MSIISEFINWLFPPKSNEEFIERVKNMDWSSSKLKPLEPDKIDLVVEKLDKIIELLTSLNRLQRDKSLIVNSPISVITRNESSVQTVDIIEALAKLTQRLEVKKKDDRVMIVEFSDGKRLREGLMNNDGSVEWVRKFS